MPKLRAGKIKCSIVSVTSILSRLTECFIVSRYLFPTVPENDLASQFAYRPPGNTTAALIYLNHHVSKLLENNNYVWCHMTDDSKAFDSINHSVLAHKLARLGLPHSVFNW